MSLTRRKHYVVKMNILAKIPRDPIPSPARSSARWSKIPSLTSALYSILFYFSTCRYHAFSSQIPFTPIATVPSAFHIIYSSGLSIQHSLGQISPNDCQCCSGLFVSTPLFIIIVTTQIIVSSSELLFGTIKLLPHPDLCPVILGCCVQTSRCYVFMERFQRPMIRLTPERSIGPGPGPPQRETPPI